MDLPGKGDWGWVGTGAEDQVVGVGVEGENVGRDSWNQGAGFGGSGVEAQ